MAMSYNNLANILHDQGKLEEAIAYHERSLPLQRQLFGNDHPRTAGSINNMAAVFKDLGELDRALPLYRQTLDIDRRSLGDEHPFVAQDMVNVASALTALGQFEEAQLLFDSAAVLQASHSEASRASHKNEYGYLLMLTGRLDEAERVTREALEFREENLPEESWVTALTRAHLGAILVRQGREAEASPLLRAAHARLLAVKGPNARETRFAAEALEDAGASQR